MLIASSAVELPPDPALDGVQGLLGDEACKHIVEFVEGNGWSVEGLLPVQVTYRLGESCIGRFNLRTTDPKGDSRLLGICIESRTDVPSTLPIDDGWDEGFDFPTPVARSSPYLLWCWPFDPSLRSLSHATLVPKVQSGLADLDRRPLALAISSCRYRPRSRALLKYLLFDRFDGRRRRGTLYAKVMRTRRARHVLGLADALRTPHGYFGSRTIDRWRNTGAPLALSLPVGSIGGRVLLYEPARGQSLTRLLIEDQELPRPERIADLLHEIAALGRDVQAPSRRQRNGPLRTAKEVAVLLSHLRPHLEGTIGRILEVIADRSELRTVQPCAVHGDLYEAQVFVSEDFSIELIDVDDFGVGDPALDAANFTSHLLALAVVQPNARARILAYRSLLRTEFLVKLDIPADELAWREALVMLQLATGPFRTLQPEWPTRVDELIEIAERLLVRV